ncbi:MAG: alpha/beta hydrolase fold protein [Ramlibacter sp.]|uniref:alpha/beta fold hydrolase n=1 Tax=Ramlibacter sp. TaxID=1917967 RepID=UPI00261744F0|nr:alpha/beta hydrolase [Ramlibacter sp.]MDB5750461.1 alpha/beta hydrolase fold protein [Ramlibacter sp.]
MTAAHGAQQSCPPDQPADALREQLALLEQRFAQCLLALPSGGQVAVRECGTPAAPGHAIVLLHGISSGAASWLHVALPLGEQFWVLAWDAPGYGDSTPLQQAAPAAQDYAQRLDEVLAAAGVSSCLLVGHSLGCLMATAYASQPRAVRVERVVLLAPARGYGAAGQEQEREKVVAGRRDALHRDGVAGLSAGIDKRLLSPQAGAAERALVRWNTSRMHAAGYLQAVAMLGSSELALLPVTVPVEVHCGDADVVTTPAQSRGAAERLGAPCHAIANSGHACPVEQPAAVAQVLLGAARSTLEVA